MKRFFTEKQKNNVEYQGHLNVKRMMLSYYRSPKKIKMIKLLKSNVKCQGHLKVKVIMYVCEKVMA